jgi:hypothetical protein
MPPRTRPGALAALWPPLAYLALSVLMTWPLAAHLGARLPGLGDALQQTWILAWNAHILRTDPAAFWQAPIFYPYPDTAAYHDHHLIQSIVGAPLIWATGNPVLAHNVLVLLSFALTGWAVFLLARDVAAEATPDAPPAAVAWAAFAAGCAVAFSSYRMAHLVHLNLLQTAWLPLALLFLRRLLRPRAAGGWRWGDAALLGLFTGLQIANAFYYGYFAIVVLAGYGALWAVGALWRRARVGEPLPWGMLPRLALAVAVAAALAVPLLLPYLRIYRTLGIVRSVAEVENWSAPLRAYISVVASNRLYGPIGEAVVDAGEMVLFPGLLLALLGLAGAALGLRAALRRPAGAPRPRGDLIFWALLAAGALVLSLGVAVRLVRFGEPLPIPTPYLLLYAHVPGFGSMRVPSRWGWLVTLALALLAAAAAARLLARLRPPWRHVAGAALVGVVLAEQAAFPLPLTRPVLADVPPVYAWLGAPAQADLTTLIELPVGPSLRGEELERTIWRHFYSLEHWKRQPIAYGAVIPFGASELLRRLQSLPDPEVIGYLQLIGVDTLVIHRDEYDPAELAALTAGLDALPQLRRRAEVDASLIYTIAPDPGMSLPPGSVYVSSDERMPGLPVLGLIRRWQAEGRDLYGPGRVRFYAPMADPLPGQVADFGLLAAGEDPAAAGYSPGGRIWEGQGLALYRRDPALLASLPLGAPPPGQFHPRHPDSLELTSSASGLRVGDQELSWAPAVSAVAVELDVASLGGDLRAGDRPLGLAPGLSTVRLPLELGTTLRLEGAPGGVAILRLRAVQPTAVEGAVAPRPGLAASADAAFDGAMLKVDARGAGAAGVQLNVQGAAARDDRPVYLLSGALPLPPGGGAVSFVVDPLRPAAPWLAGSEAPQDGRYIVYLRGQGAGGAGQPVAQFQIRDGQVTGFTPVPLPLAAVP